MSLLKIKYVTCDRRGCDAVCAAGSSDVKVARRNAEQQGWQRVIEHRQLADGTPLGAVRVDRCPTCLEGATR